MYIENLEIYARHGVLSEENILGQKFLVSIQLYFDLKKPAGLDNIEKSVNYGEVCHFVKETVENTQYNLIETVADNLCRKILLKYNKVEKVKIILKKPWAPILLPLEYVAVEMEREWNDVYIGMGSNMGEKQFNIDTAINLIQHSENIKLLKQSAYIQTKPVGYLEQEDFLNSVIQIQTILTPQELLEYVQIIEKQLKRERIIKWGPRTIDLDILIYGNQVVYEENLIIPHPHMQYRGFVLEPIVEIAPYLIHPVLKKSMLELKENLQ